MTSDALPADLLEVRSDPGGRGDRPTVSELLSVLGPASPGGPWWWAAAVAAGLSAISACLTPIMPDSAAEVLGYATLAIAPIAAALACMGARRAAAPSGRATWKLLAVGAVLAALGQVAYARTELSGLPVAFPTLGFHLLVGFHVAFAEGAILALRPAHEARPAAEISLDGALILLAGSAIVLRFVLDTPLARGELSEPQVVAILIGQLALSASLLFTTLLVLWRDAALSGPAVDSLLVTAILFGFGDLLLVIGVEAAPSTGGLGLDSVRLVGWGMLCMSAGLATVRPEGPAASLRREQVARLFRLFIVPAAPLFFAAWALDAVHRETISAASTVVGALMGVLLAARIATALYAVEQEAKERRGSARLAAVARLRAVTAQINPHFLFNALHSLAALVRRDAAATEAALERLGRLLRYGLDSGEELVTLREEWAFALDYLELEALRLGPRLVVSTDMPQELTELAVPPFVLQPIVENAIRHGVSPFPEGGRVSVQARVADSIFTIQVTDSGPGTDVGTLMGARGVGVRAVCAQLETHFPGAWSLSSSRTDGGEFAVTLTFPAEG